MGIFHDGGFIVKKKGDVECVGIDEESKDANQKEMENSLPINARARL